MKIFYHLDHDGECSAYLIKQIYPEAECVGMNYNKRFPIEIVQENEQVYIVDFSIEPFDMECLLAKTGLVIWIDHHISAINKYKSFTQVIPGIREVGKAGCELTWQWLYQNNKYPLYVAYIGDRDVWRKALDPHSTLFYYGLMLYDTNPNSKQWELIKGKEETIIEFGAHIEHYRNLTFKRQINSGGRIVNIDNYKCLVFNTQERGSEIFNGWEGEEYDIMMPYNMDNNGLWKMSAYTTKDIDLTKLSIGLSGHAKACGKMNMEKLPW